MTVTATVRVMSPEEITAQSGGETPFLLLADSRTVFGERSRFGGAATGPRYLSCGVCATQWHLPRLRCTHCGSDKHVAYQSLAASDAVGEAASARAAKAAVQAETGDDCHHYLKFLYSDRDPLVDPVADDLATMTLDLLVSEAGLQRHGINLMLLFGAPESPPDRGGG